MTQHNNSLVSIKLKFVPFHAMFRFDKTWWYHIPASDSPENAVMTSLTPKIKDVRLEHFSNDTVVAAYVDEIPNNLARYGKAISLYEK